MAIVEIIPGRLYAGGKLDEKGWRFVKRNVAAVMNLSTERDVPPSDMAGRLQLVHEPMKNRVPPKLTTFHSVVLKLGLLLDSDAVVYLHDTAGINRLGTVLIAFYMQRFGLSQSEALRRVRSKKPNVKPNRHYQALLDEYERYLHGA